MAAKFDGPQACDDGRFTIIRFRETVPDNHPVRFIDKFIDTIRFSFIIIALFLISFKYILKCRKRSAKS